jgi:spore coat protein U-like protein
VKKKVALLFFVFVCSYVFAFNSSNSISVIARVNSVLSVAMDSPNAFSVVDSSNNLIPEWKIGSIVAKSSYQAWTMVLSSAFMSSNSVGRLKIDGGEVYIPYTFAIKDGETVVLSRFETSSTVMPPTSFQGKEFILYFYFTDDDTIWPQGIYRDTLVLTVTTD